MKTSALILAALVGVLLAVPAPAPAAPCQAQHCAPAVVAAAPVVGAPAIVAAAVVTPLYGAQYTGGGYDDETKELLRQLLVEVKAMRQDLAAGKPGGGDAPVGTLNLASPSVQAVLSKSCASCHTGDKPRGGFAMYTGEGKPIQLSPADRREVERQVKGGLMPKAPARIGPADRDVILRAVAAGK